MRENDHRRGFYFYALAPFLLVFLVAMPFLVRPPTLWGWVAFAGCEMVALLVLLGLYDVARFFWCWRCVGGAVALAYVAYLVDMVVRGEFWGDGRRATACAFNAFCGLVVFGYPGLWFALFGRLPRMPTPYADATAESDYDFDEMYERMEEESRELDD